MSEIINFKSDNASFWPRLIIYFLKRLGLLAGFVFVFSVLGEVNELEPPVVRALTWIAASIGIVIIGESIYINMWYLEQIVVYTDEVYLKVWFFNKVRFDDKVPKLAVHVKTKVEPGKYFFSYKMEIDVEGEGYFVQYPDKFWIKPRFILLQRRI